MKRRQMSTAEWHVFDAICACQNRDGLHACDVTAVRVVERLRHEGLLPAAHSESLPAAANSGEGDTR